jgi:hypothetical protein
MKLSTFLLLAAVSGAWGQTISVAPARYADSRARWADYSEVLVPEASAVTGRS